MLEDTFGLDIGEGAPLDQEVSDEGFHGFETFKVENISSGSGSLSAATSRSSDGILYFGFPGFSFSRGMGLIYSDTESDLWKVMDEFFSALADEETKGIIIDMRGNEGGNVAELRVAFSAFFPAGVEKIHFADTRRKSGEGMLEYGPWLSFEVSKDETMTRGSFNEDIPIAVLVNGESMSCAEFSVMFFSTLRERYGYDVTFIGSRTKGATGEVAGSDEIYNAGSFEIQPYITGVHTPFCQTRYFDGTIYEGVGIGVDVDGGYSYDAFSRGDDPALTKAVGILEEKIGQMESSFHL